jgi:hypothetical protein
MKTILLSLIAMTGFLAAQAAEQPGGSQAGKLDEQQAAYDKAVKACQSRSGADKQKCIEAAKARHGEMLK